MDLLMQMISYGFGSLGLLSLMVIIACIFYDDSPNNQYLAFQISELERELKYIKSYVQEVVSDYRDITDDYIEALRENISQLEYHLAKSSEFKCNNTVKKACKAR